MSMGDFTAHEGLSRWIALPGFFSVEEAVAVQLLVKRLGQGAQVVELGTYQGKSAVAIASVLPPEGLLHCVDTFQGMVLKPGQDRPPMQDVVQANLNALARHLAAFGVGRKVRVLVGDTSTAAKRFAEQSLDLVHIDAGHQYEDVRRDITDWYPKLKVGGFLVFDDVEPAWPGVVQAVRESGLQGGFAAPSLFVHRRSETSSPSFGPDQEPADR
jgi:predicted O-methyltransferase YrrM